MMSLTYRDTTYVLEVYRAKRSQCAVKHGSIVSVQLGGIVATVRRMAAAVVADTPAPAPVVVVPSAESQAFCRPAPAPADKTRKTRNRLKAQPSPMLAELIEQVNGQQHEDVA